MRAIHASQASLSMGGLAFLIFLGAVSAQAAAVPTVSTHFLQFGPVPVGGQRVLPIEYGNTGDEPWVVDGLEFLGGQRFEFGVEQGLGGFVVLPGEHLVRDITFAPADFGVRAAYLHAITEFGIPQQLSQVMGTGVVSTGIDDPSVPAASGLRLSAPFPNPARGQFSLEYAGANGAAALTIYDAAGRPVRSLASAAPAGRFEWNGRTERGELAPAGVYLLRLASGGQLAVRTAVLLR